jgi:hypothetical protein
MLAWLLTALLVLLLDQPSARELKNKFCKLLATRHCADGMNKTFNQIKLTLHTKFICAVKFVLIYFLFTCTAFADGHAGHLSSKIASKLPGDLLLFTDFTSINRFDQEPNKKLGDNDLIPSLNAFYTFDYNKFRFLGEWLVNTKSHNLERLQLGWHLGESSLWMGRFHNPIGYWNMQFHHGAYLQTSISRPGIMAFETGGGVIPNHLTGFLWEGIHEFDTAGIYYTLGVGAGPGITNRMHALNILDPGGSHRPGVSFRLGYQPVSYGSDEFGISGAYTEIPIDSKTLTQTKQLVAGAYANWQYKSLRVLSEAVYAHNWLDNYSNNRTNSGFFNTYGQLEWNFQPDWTLFGRAEGTFGNVHNNQYLALFPKYVEDRFMVGMHYKLRHNMALKVEASRDHISNDHFNVVMFQWSALFP